MSPRRLKRQGSSHTQLLTGHLPEDRAPMNLHTYLDTSIYLDAAHYDYEEVVDDLGLGDEEEEVETEDERDEKILA